MRRTGLLVLLTAVCWAVRVSPDIFAAEPAPTAPPKTLEEQLKYLQGALAESLRSEDWKMLELAAEGIAKAKLGPNERELLVVRAERQAALELLSGSSGWTGEPSARIETWGLAARALAGDKDGLEQLRAMVTKPSAGTTAPPEAKAFSHLDLRRQMLDRQRQGSALLCLALLKEPGVVDKVKACLDSWKSAEAAAQRKQSYWSAQPATAIVLAALVAGPDEGWKALLAFCTDKDARSDERLSVFSAIQNVQRTLSDEKWQKMQPFSLVMQLKPKLPETAAQDLSKTYIGMIEACDGKDFQSTQQLIQSAYSMKLDADGAAALNDLRGRITGQNSQYLQQAIDQALKNAPAPSRPAKPVKPPAPPDATF